MIITDSTTQIIPYHALYFPMCILSYLRYLQHERTPSLTDIISQLYHSGEVKLIKAIVMGVYMYMYIQLYEPMNVFPT